MCRYRTPCPARHDWTREGISTPRLPTRRRNRTPRITACGAVRFLPWRRSRNRYPQLRQSSTPVATIPLVCALAGNGTWLAYALATAAILLVAWCVSRFARYSSSPGSLYTYAHTILPPWMAAVAGWSLLLAYIATGSSVIGGFYNYGNVVLGEATGHVTSTVFLSLLVTGISIWIACRDVKISARVMLWIEAASLLAILIVIVTVLRHQGLHGDWDQLRLRSVTGSGLRLGLVLALFSFVGFESATTLGAEARDPLRTIPRAVIQSSIIAGAFFTVSAYTEVLGFHVVGQDLGTSQVPMHVLAQVGGVPVFGILIDIGALVSLFACTLACITAAARVLLLMSHNGLAHGSLRSTHAQHETPVAAIVVTWNCRCRPGRGACISRIERLGCLRMDGFARDLRFYRYVCACLHRAA